MFKTISFLLLGVVCSSAIAQQINPDRNVHLYNAEQQIRAAFASLGDELDADQLEFEYADSSESLLVKYRTRDYKIHGRSKMGEINEQAEVREGPGFRGFLLRVHLEDAGNVNQAVTPQTIREPYWNTDLDVTRMQGTDKQFYTTLSYGKGVDQELLQQIRQAFAGMESTAPPAAREQDVLEGFLRIHPKFHYKYYVDGFGDGQECALFGAEEQLAGIEPGSLVRIEGILGSKISGDPDNRGALRSTWIIYMDVERVKVLRNPEKAEKMAPSR